jgi:hypothetical protein
MLLKSNTANNDRLFPFFKYRKKRYLLIAISSQRVQQIDIKEKE